jgi:hypothetical protein
MYQQDRSEDSSVDIPAGYGHGGRSSFPVGARDLSSLHSVQTGSESHSASYSMGTMVSFPGG